MVINGDPEWEAERSWQPCLSCLHESIKVTVGGIQNWRRRWSPMAVVEARMHTRTAAAEHFQNMKHDYRLKEESSTLFALTREHNWHALQLSPVAAVPAHTAAFGTPRTKKRTHWSVVAVERTLVSWRVFPRQSGQRACPCVRGLHHTHSPGSARKGQFSALVCGSNWCSHVASAATGREVSFIACKTGNEDEITKTLWQSRQSSLYFKSCPRLISKYLTNAAWTNFSWHQLNDLAYIF